MTIQQPIVEKPSLEEESDTDIGSHGMSEEESYSFDKEDNDHHHHRQSSPPSSLTRMGAKVRRLNLNDGGNNSMDVKISLARRNGISMTLESPAVKAWLSGGNNQQRTPPSASSAAHDTSQLLLDNNSSSPILSPRLTLATNRLNGSPNRTTGAMLICPPSTIKKSRMSRLFANQNDEKDEKEGDEISPRDVTEFPSFPATPPSSRKKRGKENNGSSLFNASEPMVNTTHTTRDVASPPTTMLNKPNRSFFPSTPPSTRKKLGKENHGILNRDSDIRDSGLNCEYSPRSPPSTLQKPNRRMMDLNYAGGRLLTSSPPKGLGSYGRANSFLQMFSQGSNENDDGRIREDEDNDFLRRCDSEDDEDVNSTMPSHDFQLAVPSPKRPMRSHHRNRGLDDNHNDNTANSSSNSFSRFLSDFELIGTLGTGSFGSVHSVRNRTDRRMYAIKAAKREARSNADRNRMLQEVYALASLCDRACEGEMHVVRYHQAWMEGRRLYIQTELCELTLCEEMRIESVAMMGSHGASGGNNSNALMGEKRRYKLLREMLLALDLVHKSGMIHLDIKPENIFIKNDQYKLGDFGLVSKIENHDDVEEGDSRYMSRELLLGDLDDLTKSDIFSLGATMYEICLLGHGGPPKPLPENGQEWQDMRDGKLRTMPNTPFDMQMIVREMMAPDPNGRPSAEELLKRRQLLSEGERQLIVERNKATAANRALDIQMQRFKLLSPKNGRKFERSNTIC